MEMQHPDWYILRGPENTEIYAVYGDIDGTLVVTDRYRAYYSKNKGKTWTQSTFDSKNGLLGFAVSNDTLFTLDTQTMSGDDPGNRYAIRPAYFSLDGGVTWDKLTQRPGIPEMKTPLNYGFSANGIRFSIDEIIQPVGTIEYLGIVTENGRKIALPQQHALNNVYFDQKSRLYISASAPLCNKDGYVQLCNKQDVRGTLYISKKPINY
ncbi:sialidase family protein [Dyadobacter sp. CY326]|uniref:sialidase family protein n=1 Tax=Dyadobacter sp. CY326 TaxID=2907300 RepID=UPI001F3CA12E|nr:sialidase family protein [Dyadobacter sp. CY326]MCE7066980.1 glycoside hydrolase [Dyadobacter sp. CY326]